MLKISVSFPAKMRLFEIHKVLVSLLMCLKNTVKHAIPKKSGGIDATLTLWTSFIMSPHSLEAK